MSATVSRIESCWCGSSRLDPFGAGYACCEACGTLVREERPPGDLDSVRDESSDLYGRAYWFERQTQLGLPDLEERSRADLGERCLHWLRYVLLHRLPPGRSLDLGAAHGGFVALLAEAGFDAVGVELSPWVVDFARRSFEVEMLRGPVEGLELEAGSFNLVSAMDVIEHLPDPLTTLRRCAELLAPDGLLFLQTPCHQAGRSLAEVESQQDRFLDMLLPEHLHLFTRESITALCAQAGFPEVAFLPACFPDYDMFLVAGREPITPNDDSETRSHLEARPGGRMVATLLELDRQLRAQTDAYLQADRDRRERQTQIGELHTLLTESERRLADQAEVALATREELGRLASQVGELRLAGSEARRTLDEERSARTRLEVEHRELTSSVDRLTEGMAALERELQNQRRALRRQGRRQAALEQALKSSEIAAQLPTLPHLVAPDVTWRFCDPISAPSATADLAACVAIDLTALRPGGENGGAGLIATTLVQQFSRLEPETPFLLLTSEACHHRLAELDAANVERRMVKPLPEALSEICEQTPVQLLLCPTTAPPFVDPRVATVCVIHDLQFRFYPQFFDDHERSLRERALGQALDADLVITVSHTVREQVLELFGLPAERVIAVPNGAADRLPEVSEREIDGVLARRGLELERYFLYPANFWAHKNHRLLLTAFAQLLDRRPDCGIDLVLTGAATPDPRPLRRAVRRMGLEGRVHFTGYIPDGQLAALLRGCLALVFPSLYEGFGMPVVEAMASARPVLCSRITSLREVAADAALFFDPRKPGEIVAAMERVLDDPELVARVCRRGPARAAELGDAETMARSYLEAIASLPSLGRRHRDRLGGVYSDGWTLKRFAISYREPEAELELGLRNPRHEMVTVSVAGAPRREVRVEPQHQMLVRCELPADPGLLELAVDSTFCPADGGVSQDRRQLGIQITSCRLFTSSGEVDLLAGIHGG